MGSNQILCILSCLYYFLATKARRLRIAYLRTLNYVIVRGNQRQDIFRDEVDYCKYLSLLCAYKERYQGRFFAYTLLSAGEVAEHIGGMRPCARRRAGEGERYGVRAFNAPGKSKLANYSV